MFLILEGLLGVWAAWKLVTTILGIGIACFIGLITYKGLQVLAEMPAPKAYWCGVLAGVGYLFGHSLLVFVRDL